jgi:hypothetical protein
MFTEELPKTWTDLVKLQPRLQELSSQGNFRSETNKLIYDCYNQNTPKNQRNETLLKDIAESETGLILNNFYYDRLLKHLPHVRHYCYWYPDPDKKDIQIQSELEKITPNHDFIFFTNLLQAKSVPELPHSHVFINYEYVLFKPPIN